MAGRPCSSISHKRPMILLSSVVRFPARRYRAALFPIFLAQRGQQRLPGNAFIGEKMLRLTRHTACLFGGNVTSTVTISASSPIARFASGQTETMR